MASKILSWLQDKFLKISDYINLPLDIAISKVEESLIDQHILLRTYQKTKNNERTKFKNILISVLTDIFYLIFSIRCLTILFNEDDIQLGRFLGNSINIKEPLGFCYIFWAMWTCVVTVVLKQLFHIGQYVHRFDIYTDMETWKNPRGFISSKLTLKDMKIVQLLLSAHRLGFKNFSIAGNIFVIGPTTIYLWLLSDQSESTIGQIYEVICLLVWLYWVHTEAPLYFTFPYLAIINCFYICRRFKYVNDKIDSMKIRSTDRCKIVRDKISRLIDEHDEVCEIVRQYNKSFKYPIAILSIFFSLVSGTLVPIGLGKGAMLPLMDMIFQAYIFTVPFITLGMVHMSANSCYQKLAALSVRFPAKYDPIFKRKVLRKLKELSHHQPVAFYSLDIEPFEIYSIIDMFYIPSISYGMLLISNRRSF